MKCRVITVDPGAPQAEAIRQACQVLASGGLVAFPTDTLYALGASAWDPAAVERVLTAKGRHHGKPLSVLVGSLEDAAAMAAALTDEVRDLMQAFWPGALTVVLKASLRIPSSLSAGSGTVGLRMPGGAVVLALLTAFGGPIIGTSANRAGGPDPADAKTVQKAIGGQIDLILDGGRVSLGVPSTVLDCTGSPARILREGAIPRQKLEERIRLS